MFHSREGIVEVMRQRLPFIEKTEGRRVVAGGFGVDGDQCDGAEYNGVGNPVEAISLYRISRDRASMSIRISRELVARNRVTRDNRCKGAVPLRTYEHSQGNQKCR